MDGHVVHPLRRLLFDHFQHQRGREVFDALHPRHGFIHRHRAHGHRTVPQQGFANAVNIAAGGQVHHGVSAVVHRGVQLLQLLLHVRTHRRISDVGVDLAQRIHADAHGLQLGMVDVCGNDQLSFGDLRAHQLRRNLLTLGHEQHLLRDLTLARKVHLGKVAVAAAHRFFAAPRDPLLAQFGDSLGGNSVWRDAAAVAAV